MSPATPRLQVQYKRTSDVDLHAASLSHWQQRYEQTSAGAFQGEVQELLLADNCDDSRGSNPGSGLQLFHEWANRATSQRCQLWEGGFWIGLSVAEKPHPGLRFMGRALEPQTLMTSPSGGEFALQVPAGCALYGIVLPRHALFGRPDFCDEGSALPANRADCPQLWHLAPLARMRLVGLLREIFRNLDTGHCEAEQSLVSRMLHGAVCTVLRDVLHTQRCSATSAHGKTYALPHRQRHCDTVARSCEWALAHSAQAPGIEALCNALHITPRTLQNSFQEVLGISPAFYLRSLRLNQVRRALQEPPAVHGQLPAIADIASQWGFWHLGHFGESYKALFGETPSETRSRSLQGRF